MFKQKAKLEGWTKKAESEYYSDYLNLLKSVKNNLNGRGVEIYTIEMLLFSKAEELIKKAFPSEKRNVNGDGSNKENIDMNKSEIFEFLNANPVFHLATVEGNKPHVRGMLLYRADENGIIFHTGKMKDIHKQLTENPRVELSFNNGNFENLIQIRISGTVALIEDPELKKEIVQKREFLKPFVEQAGYEPLAVYRMKNGVATIWTMKTNFAPKEFVEL